MTAMMTKNVIMSWISTVVTCITHISKTQKLIYNDNNPFQEDDPPMRAVTATSGKLGLTCWFITVTDEIYSACFNPVIN